MLYICCPDAVDRIQCIGQPKLLNSANQQHQTTFHLINEDSNGKVWPFFFNIFSSPNAVLFAGDVKSKTVCFAFEELGFDSVVTMSLFRSWSAVLNCTFQLSSFLCIDIHFILSNNISPVTVASQRYTQHWLCPVSSEHKHGNILVKALNDYSWKFNNFRVLYKKSLSHRTFLMIGI